MLSYRLGKGRRQDHRFNHVPDQYLDYEIGNVSFSSIQYAAWKARSDFGSTGSYVTSTKFPTYTLIVYTVQPHRRAMRHHPRRLWEVRESKA